MYHDWRYTPERLKLREQALKILMLKYGSELKDNEPKYTSQSMYECCHDWVSGGNLRTDGIIKYYEAYYT